MEKLLTAVQLESLRAWHHTQGKHETELPRKFTSAEVDSKFLDDWKERGSPHLWIIVEEAHGYSAAVDHGYGRLALLKGNNLIKAGADQLIAGEVVLLNKDYYDAPGWLYFRNIRP